MPTGPGGTWQHGRIPRFDRLLKRKKKAPDTNPGPFNYGLMYGG
jgi:hypothetical protein